MVADDRQLNPAMAIGCNADVVKFDGSCGSGLDCSYSGDVLVLATLVVVVTADPGDHMVVVVVWCFRSLERVCVCF